MSKQFLSKSLSSCGYPFLSSWFSLHFSLNSALCWWAWALTTGGADVRLPGVFPSPRWVTALPTESEWTEWKPQQNQSREKSTRHSLPSGVTPSQKNSRKTKHSRIEAEMVRLLFGASRPAAVTCLSEALVWTLLVGLCSPSRACSSPW